ncbi:MAG TPA: class I SAM-dependent methyltransferase [Coleofasciculaceae cyanobacterium]|jgi:SAM-dependent methyltransferase
MPSENRYTAYDPWAWLYNQSEAHLALQNLMPLLEKLLLPRLPENGQILDLCCGTGQVSQQLILKGYHVTGLDGSEKMLHYARENAPQGKFVLEDARSFEFSPTFDAVISTDSSLNHIMSLDELKQVFRNVYGALKNQGLFLFDLGLEDRYRNVKIDNGELHPEYAWTVGETYDRENKTGTFTITLFQPNSQVQPNSQTQPSSQNLKPKAANLGTLIQLKCFLYNRILRPLHPSVLLQLVDKDWLPLTLTFSVKPYAKQDVQTALEEVGFTQVAIYDFRGNVAAPNNTQSVYFVACKSAD